MLGVDGVGDRRYWAILVRNLSAENWKIQEERKRSIQERREMASEQPSSTAEKGLNRVHPTCTERQSLNKECGWKGGDRSGLAQGQELTGRKRRTKTSLQEEKEKKQKNTLDSYRPSHGRTKSRRGSRI